MRIPSAFDAGFGQQIAAPKKEVFPDTGGAEAIAAGGEKIGKSLLGYAVQENEYKGRIDLMRANAEQQAQEQATREQAAQQKELDRSKAQLAMVKYTGELDQAKQFIIEQGDPAQASEQFRDVARQAQERLLTEVPAEFHPIIAPQFAQHTSNKVIEVQIAAGKLIQSEAWGTEQRAAETVLNDPTRTLDEKLALINDPNFLTGAGAVSPAEISAARQKLTQTASKQDILSRLNTEQPQAILNDLTTATTTGAWLKYPGLDQADRTALISHVTDKINQQAHQEQMERQQAAHLAEVKRKNAFDALQGLVKEGYTIPVQTDLDARKSFAGTPYAAMYSGLVQQSTSLAFRQELINKDPLTYYARQKGFDVPALNLAQPIGPQLAARGTVAKSAMLDLALPYPPLLKTEEIKAVGDYLTKLDPSGKVQVVESMVKSWGAQGVNAFARQLAGTGYGDSHGDDMPVIVGLVAAGKTNAARLVAQGGEYVKKGAGVEKSVWGELSKSFDKEIGSALGYMPSMKTTMATAVNAAYVGLVRTNGADPAKLDKGLYQQAFQSVIGDVGYVAGKTTILPQGWSEGQFKSSIKKITPEIVGANGGMIDPRTMKPMSNDAAARLLREDASWWETGGNTYQPQVWGARAIRSDGKGFFKLTFGGQ